MKAQTKALYCRECVKKSFSELLLSTNGILFSCAKWAADSAKPYCVGASTIAQKATFCSTTCAFEIVRITRFVFGNHLRISETHC